MSKKIAIAFLAVATIAGGGWWLAQDSATTSPISIAAVAQDGGATDAQLALVPDMVLGAEDAPVTMVEYASYTCPHCANFHATVFDRLKADYIDTGKVKFVYREVYFDRFGLWAGMVARCGGAERYFGIADLLYDEQKNWIGDGDPATIGANLRKIGLKAGIGPEAMDVCLNDNVMAEAMVAVFQKNATADEINSTPSFVIDGAKYSNMAYEDMQKLLDEKLAN